jgi:hypothetical protein
MEVGVSFTSLLLYPLEYSTRSQLDMRLGGPRWTLQGV